MSGRVRLATSLHSKLSPTCHRRQSLRARPLFTRAVALFGALRASVFEARRSPTDFCKLQRRAGTATIDSRFLAGTVTAITFLFYDAPRPLPCGSGDARRAALRPFGPASVPVPPGCPGLPDRDAFPIRLTILELPRGCVVRIDVHRPSDRVKDVSPRREESFLRTLASGARALLAASRRRSPPRRSEEHPLSPVRPPAGEETPASEPDRSRPLFHRRPAKAADFPRTRCFPPPRSRALQRIAPPGFPCRPLAHAAHTFSPGWGKVLFWTLQAPPGFDPRELRESRRLF
jgi:hypothetical protein